MARSENDIWESFEKAKDALKGHPSVRSVELGFKVSGGKLTDQLALRVYVDRKRSLDEIDAADVIPDEIEGLPTDVIMVRESAFLGHDMTGGDQITSVTLNEPGNAQGTIGYIATVTASGAPVILSNEHVLLHARAGLQPRLLFQLDVSNCLGTTCNKVGRTLDGLQGDYSWPSGTGGAKDYFIDCAIGEIIDTDYKRGVKSLDSITGSRDLTSTPASAGSPIAVRKVGQKTGLTEGVVVSVNSTGEVRDGPEDVIVTQRTMLIRATGGHQFDETFTVADDQKADLIQAFNDAGGPDTVTDLGGGQLRFQVPVFADDGDSGSALVTTDGAVVGLVFSTEFIGFGTIVDDSIVRHRVPVGESRACHIAPVMERMGLRIDPATEPSGGDAATSAGQVIASAETDPGFARPLAGFETALQESERGRCLLEIIDRHGYEIADLVRNDRRVMVAWHRFQGPAFAAAVLGGLRDGSRAMPRVHKGIRRDQFLDAMEAALRARATPALVQSLDANRDWLREVFLKADDIAGLRALLRDRSSEAAHV